MRNHPEAYLEPKSLDFPAKTTGKQLVLFY